MSSAGYFFSMFDQIYADFHKSVHLLAQELGQTDTIWDYVRIIDPYCIVTRLGERLHEFFRDADQVRDCHHRQPGRHVGHEIELACVDHTIDDLLGALVDLLAESGNCLRCEGRAHDLAIPSVIRRVHCQKVRRTDDVPVL